MQVNDVSLASSTKKTYLSVLECWKHSSPSAYFKFSFYVTDGKAGVYNRIKCNAAIKCIFNARKEQSSDSPLIFTAWRIVSQCERTSDIYYKTTITTVTNTNSPEIPTNTVYKKKNEKTLPQETTLRSASILNRIFCQHNRHIFAELWTHVIHKRCSRFGLTDQTPFFTFRGS